MASVFIGEEIHSEDRPKNSLKFLLEQMVIQPQYQKWIAKLLGYSFEVVYKPDLENKAVDALSRMLPNSAHKPSLSPNST